MDPEAAVLETGRRGRGTELMPGVSAEVFGVGAEFVIASGTGSPPCTCHCAQFTGSGQQPYSLGHIGICTSSPPKITSVNMSLILHVESEALQPDATHAV